ncbi:hypothetical protein F5887DRAFT_919587 [Amanita rubescens]|nr:hypothetical protein F5887DRAFT_919587 [Amanita rubescens]
MVAHLLLFLSSSVLSRLSFIDLWAERQIDAGDGGAPNLVIEIRNEDFFEKKKWLRIFSLLYLLFLFSFVTARRYGSLSGLNVKSTRATAGHRIRRSKAKLKIKKMRLHDIPGDNQVDAGGGGIDNEDSRNHCTAKATSRAAHRIRIEVNGDCTSEEYDWSTAAMVFSHDKRGNRNCSDAHPGQARRPSGDDGSSLNGGPGQTDRSRFPDPHSSQGKTCSLVVGPGLKTSGSTKCTLKNHLYGWKWRNGEASDTH